MIAVSRALLFGVSLAVLAWTAPDEDCFGYYYGPAKNWAMARTCLERSLGSSPCAEPELDRLYLGAMYLDGQGGPADPAKARSLFERCSRNWDVELLFKAAQSRAAAKSPADQALDYCREGAGSTYMLKMCDGVRADALARTTGSLEGPIREHLDNLARALFDAEKKRWGAFTRADAEVAAEQARGGTAEQLLFGSSMNQHEERRVAMLKRFADYRPDAAHDGAMLRAAEKNLDEIERELNGLADEAMRKLLGDARRAWIEYREGEAAFYGAVFGGRFGRPAVETDIRVRLTTQRAEELTETLKEPYFR